MKINLDDVKILTAEQLEAEKQKAVEKALKEKEKELQKEAKRKKFQRSSIRVNNFIVLFPEKPIRLTPDGLLINLLRREYPLPQKAPGAILYPEQTVRVQSPTVCSAILRIKFDC